MKISFLWFLFCLPKCFFKLFASPSRVGSWYWSFGCCLQC